MPTYLITGANRGLGLEFVRQLSASDTNTILACTRFPSQAEALTALATSTTKVHVVECDIASIQSIESLHSKITTLLGDNAQIDYLLNNAGILNDPENNVLSMTHDGLLTAIQVNVLGPAKTVQTLLPFLRSGSVIMNMTSGLGSCHKTLHEIKAGLHTTYSISKAALNMLTVQQSLELQAKGIRVICMDPGWVKTRMGGEAAMLEPEVSIKGMLKVIHGLKETDTGLFMEYSGEELPW